ncbi:MAG TPA: ATP-binding protein [Gemmataceae bacterium]|nr:ATP-binding protein [Gemmataceae bacterium]
MAPAASANKDRDSLVANGLAHKLRNSLNAMRTHIALVQKFTASSTEPRVPRQLGKLEEAIVGIEEILCEFLAFASPPATEWTELELPSVVREVLDFVTVDLEQGGVAVAEQYPPDLPKLYTDRNKLKRVFLNLLVNARQAMPEGGRVTIQARPTNDGYLVVEIRDNGCGIPEPEQAQVFQPFFTTKSDGLGLGLPVVKRTVEDLGGQVSFESKPDVGTVFRLLLPVAERCREELECAAHQQQWLDPVSR